jgi:hypothetical protein
VFHPSTPDLIVYRVVFHCNKELFCDPKIGPVHYCEFHSPPYKTRIRVIAVEVTFEFPVPGSGWPWA